MTYPEIKALIEQHPEALDQALAGADNACAAWLTENTEQAVTTEMVSEAMKFHSTRFPELDPQSPDYVAPGSVPPVVPGEGEGV